jgi:hypothetical protein
MVEICTSNLGATQSSAGDSILRHCFVKITNDVGDAVKTLAFGPGGVSSEPYPDVASVQCHVHLAGLSADDIRRVQRLFNDCADRGYAWGKNNCCSCAIEAVERAFDLQAHPAVRMAAKMIQQSPNPFE